MWLNRALCETTNPPWRDRFPEIDSRAAAERIAGMVQRTPIVRFPDAWSPDGLEVHGKLECRQETGSFKSRGALNNILQLTDDERARGVVASSSGNHGRALAWAAKRAGVPATIVMPEDAYPNKIEACRAEGAEVVLASDRWRADEIVEELADPKGERRLVWVHPYDRDGTIEGAGTVGLEIAKEMTPAPDVVVLCVGGGGLSAGSALALRRDLGSNVVLLGAEPTGATAMATALREGEPVRLDEITSGVQGLTTPYAGARNVQICAAALDGALDVSDEAIFAAQKLLVSPDERHGWSGEVVEPAGAAALAVVRDNGFLDAVREVRALRGAPSEASTPLRVCVTISGGNPAPAQLASLRESVSR